MTKHMIREFDKRGNDVPGNFVRPEVGLGRMWRSRQLPVCRVFSRVLLVAHACRTPVRLEGECEVVRFEPHV